VDGLNFFVTSSMTRNRIPFLSQSSTSKSRNQTRNEKGFFIKQVKPTINTTILSSSDYRTKLISSNIRCQTNSPTIINSLNYSLPLSPALSSIPSSFSSLMEEEMIHFSRITKKKDENLEALVKNHNFSSLSSLNVLSL
jgi:hypothetical protein